MIALPALAQLGIVVFGVAAVWLSQDDRPHVARWACIAGMCSQPFWFTSAWLAEQWGIFAISFVYTVAWVRGLYNFWIAPRRAAENPARETRMHKLDGRLENVTAWRPIETAPENAAPILASDGKTVVVVTFVAPKAEMRGYFGISLEDGRDSGDVYVATHWMPLPLQPTAEINPRSCPDENDGK